MPYKTLTTTIYAAP